MTQCSERAQEFEGFTGRRVAARFDGGRISSDGGALLLLETERRTGILARFAACFADHRDPRRVAHSVADLARQRVLGLCLGYEDLSDHDLLRDDALLRVLAGKELASEALAGKSTLSRLELSTPDGSAGHRYKRIALDTDAVDRLFVDAFLESEASPPSSIVIDLDATDFPLHGNQEGRFFHGYYGNYCYLPLYIFSGRHLLLARLRKANIDAAAGSRDELVKIVAQIRAAWPTTRVVIRADSGFCRDELLTWCEESRVDYVIGLARNGRLHELSQYYLGVAQCLHAAQGGSQRAYGELEYRTVDTWSRERRVVLRAEHSAHGDNPRYVVTSLPASEVDARTLYEDIYCARGEMENRIKEQQLDLFAGRASAETMRANQVRLYFASIAYTLMEALRRIGLAHTELERAHCGTIRNRLLKIGAQVRVSVRRVVVALSEAFPLQELFARALTNLRRAPPATG